MSHPRYNPYASGNQSSTQGQYGFSSSQAERDPRRAASRLGPGSSSSVIPDNSKGMLPSLMSQSLNYRPEHSRATVDEDIERSVELHISRAREGVSFLGKQMHQPIDKGSRFTSTQRDEFRSSGTGTGSYPMSSSSASMGHRHSEVEGGSNSLDWSLNRNRSTADDSQFYSSSASSKYASDSDGRFNAPSEREPEIQSIPGLDDCDYPAPDKPAAPADSSRPKYTSQSAANILMHFGLEKEDLEHLISYPEDQITPANLPFILRQIRIQKAKRTAPASQSKPYPEPQPTRSVSGMDSHGFSTSGGAGMRQEKISSAVLQPSKVIDYGHTGKYTGVIGDEVNSAGGGSMSIMDTYDSSRHSQEPLQKHTTELKSGVLGSSREQASSVTGLSSSYRSVLNPVGPPSHDQTKQLQAQSQQTSQTILSSFSVPKKDTDIRGLKSEPSKPVTLKEPQADSQSTSKSQPSCTLVRGVHPSRPGLVLIDSKKNNGAKGQSKTQGQASTVTEQMKTQQIQQKQPMERQLKQQMQLQTQKQPTQQMGQSMWPPVYSSATPVPSAPLIPNIIDASRVLSRSMFVPRPMIFPPAVPPLLPALMNLNQMTLGTSSKPPPEKVAPSKGLPTPAMMHDYAAASPRIFPHTCSLCNKECTHMKDWISHQNTSIHLEKCKLLRTRYPEWDGEITLEARETVKSSASTTAKTSHRHRQRTRHGSRSRSRSHSPRRQHGSESRREKRRSRSASPYSSRYTRRSRSRSRSYSPWNDYPTSSRYRSRSRSPERRSSPRRRDEKQSSSSRSHERRPSPKRSRERRSSPRRSRERRSSPRRSRERRSSTEESSPQRKKPSGAERLAKKLLETSAVHDLSKQSDLEAVVKTLAPALLAELAKMKSSSSSTPKKDLTSGPSKAKPSLQKTKSGESSPVSVTLQQIYNNLSHKDVISAVEQFGKVKSVVLYRSRLEAIVRFESEEDAQKLKSLKTLDVKGVEVIVAKETTVPNEQMKPPQNESTTTTTTKKVLVKPAVKGSVPPGAKAASTDKPTTQKITVKGSAKSLAGVTKTKVLVSKVKNISTKHATKTGKAGKLPVKGAVKKALIKKETSSGSTAPENQPDTVQPKQKPTSENSEGSVKDSVETAEADKATNRMVNEPTKDKEIITDAKVLASKAQTASATQKPKTPADNLAAAGDGTQEVAEETAAKAVSMPSKPATSENQPDLKKSKPEESETKVEKAAVMLKDKGEVVEPANVPVCELKHQAKLDKAKEAGDAEPMQFGETGVEATEPMEVESCADGKGEKPTTEETIPETSADKPSESQVLTSTTETSSPVETIKIQKAEQTAAAASEQQPAASKPSSTAVTDLTIGEMVEKHLSLKKIVCLKSKTCKSAKFFRLDRKLVLITRLPTYDDGCYTEDDIAQLLIPFGFQYISENIYVVPQVQVAFVQMPTMEAVYNLYTKNNAKEGIFFKGSRICFRVLAWDIKLSPIRFYKFLMKLMNSPVPDDGTKTILIKNISAREAKDLRETLKRIGFVKNYLPLLNKVFIEFKSVYDADRLGVWYSLLKHVPRYEVHRLKAPFGSTLPPRLPENTLPESKDVVARATVLPIKFGVPQGSVPSFWIPMRSHPFLFPTKSPWFIIPDYLTVQGKDNIEEASGRASMYSTVMLTGLPNGNYTHGDVARLVWRYFPKQNLRFLYYNVMVLALQRRAFVFFADWTSCCDFVRDHIANPVSVRGCKLSVHFVLQQMNPEYSEELMYKTMMEWSNTGVLEPESLEDRLLCVDVSKVSMKVVKMVMQEVASIATFVGILPLGNRICFEMADSSGVTQVLKKYNSSFFPGSTKRHIHCLKSFKQRLQDDGEITIKLDPPTFTVKAQPPAVSHRSRPPPSEPSDDRSQPAVQTSGPGGSTPSQSSTAGPGAAACEDVEKANEGEASATSSISAADVTSTSVVSDGVTSPACFSPAPSATPENVSGLLQINEDIFRVITAAVRQHRLTQQSRSHSEEKASPSRGNTSSRTVPAEDTSQRTDQDDFTNDDASSSACLIEEQNFNFDDFVTVDEVGDDDTSREPVSSSSSSSQARSKRRSSGVSSPGRQTSMRSLKTSKSSSSSSSSSKSTKGTSNSSLSPKKSSEPIKSPNKPSSSSSLSTETLSKTESPSKASNTASSSCSTHSSSTACEREKKTSAAAVQASTETHPGLLREGALNTVSAVRESDHRVSAENIAAKTVESQTKIETSSEMHPPSQGHGVELSQSQHLDVDFNVSTVKDWKESREDRKEHDVDKHAEEEEDGNENYRILDSLDDEQMDDGDQDGSTETQRPGHEEDHTVHGESYQVLDSVDDEGNTHPEEFSEMDGSFQVLDSITEYQEATSQEDSDLLQDEGSTAKQPSLEKAVPVDKSDDIAAVKDAGGKDQKDDLQVKVLTTEPSKDMEKPDGCIQNEDQPLQHQDNKDPETDVTEQETFEILDSIDDQTATEDGNQIVNTPGDQISEAHTGPIEEEEDTYQVIDSFEDQPMAELETDNKEKRTRKREMSARKDDGPSKRSGPASRTSKSEEKEKSPKKQDRMAKKYETRTKKDKEIKEASEEMVYEIVDSVEDESVQDAATTERSGRRRSARGKKDDKTTLNLREDSVKHVGGEEASYEILDSVEDETPDDERVVTTRSTRGKRERTRKTDALNEKTRKEDTPTRRRQESQERNREKTPKMEERGPPKESTPTKKCDIVRDVSADNTTYAVLDSVEDKVVNTTVQKRKRGRPKKEVKTTKKDSLTLKILDSVEDKMICSQPPTGQAESSRKENISINSEEQTKSSLPLTTSTKNEEEEEEEEEEAMYQIVDSLEDDEEELTALEESGRGGKEESNETPTKADAEKEDTATCETTVVEASEKAIDKEKSPYEIADDLEEVHDDPSAAEGSGTKNKKSTSKTDVKKGDKSTTKSPSDTATPQEEDEQKSPEKNDTSTLVDLDEVSEEEEEYPDDTAEEEELRKRQATKKKQFAKEREARRREERRSREREEREQERRSRSSSRGGGGERGGMRRTRERGRGNDENAEVDSKELVTLDEVGADVAEGESESGSQERDGEITEGELQTLVTLDEFVEEEEQEKAERSMLETHPLSQEDESVDSFNPETLVTLDEADGDEEEKPNEEQAEKTSRSAKRKHDEDTEETVNFVTVDEVGEAEEEEEKEVVTPRTRGRPRKKPRQTAVRKSTRGKKVSTKDEKEEEKEPADVVPTSVDASLSLDRHPSTLSSDGQQVQKTEVDAASQADISAASAGQELHPLNQTPEGGVEQGEEEKERWSRADIKVVSKRRAELVGPEAKRSRSQSPCVAADFTLPAFKPNNPLGQDFVVPKSGYFCNLCCVFYLDETNAKELHCGSRRHYDNLQKHYQKLEQKPSRSSTQSSQGSLSD
uniref:uncharacterized protein LOC124054689 isoform X2 n=1 Tax=Scatophagus argus TaxID=75038 RepID=UPI001ED7F1BE|nr:uncharacterized protein LOC124054689 isoform X2 [Scatophagus argus]